MELSILLVIIAICAVIGYAIDGKRGAILGGLLGVLGLIISAILRAGGK